MTNITKSNFDMRYIKRQGQIMALACKDRGELNGLCMKIREMEAEGKDPSELLRIRKELEMKLSSPPAGLPYTPESLSAVIEEAEDPVIRLALRMKYLYGVGWDDIAATVGRSAVALKTACLRFLHSKGAHRAPIVKNAPVDWAKFVRGN